MFVVIFILFDIYHLKCCDLITWIEHTIRQITSHRIYWRILIILNHGFQVMSFSNISFPQICLSLEFEKKKYWRRLPFPCLKFYMKSKFGHLWNNTGSCIVQPFYDLFVFLYQSMCSKLFHSQMKFKMSLRL